MSEIVSGYSLTPPLNDTQTHDAFALATTTVMTLQEGVPVSFMVLITNDNKTVRMVCTVCV